MRFIHIFFFTVCVGIACADDRSPAPSAPPSSTVGLLPSDANANELSVARQALRDGLWQVARMHAWKIAGDEGRLIVLETYANEDRWDDVRAELGKVDRPERNPAFGYYAAACEGKFAEAIEFLRKGGSEAGLAEAKMLEADLQVKNSNLYAAKELWAEVVALSNASERAFALASVNLGDVDAMRKAYGRILSLPLKRTVGLRLGRELVGRAETEAEGAKLIRAIVADSPDADGACDAFVAIAASEIASGRWKEAEKTLAEAMETWPDAAKRADVHEYRGDAFIRLGRPAEALSSFSRAGELSADEAVCARCLLKEGDLLAEQGRAEESMERYRKVLERYPKTETAVALRRVLRLKELEKKAREDYAAYRFSDAMEGFSQIAREDAGRREQMDYCRMLCLYGLGRDDEALAEARRLAEKCPRPEVRARALLWLAKFTYNRGEWRDATARFSSFVETHPDDPFAPEALLLAARAAYSASDFPLAIQSVTRLAERYPASPAVTAALIVQAKALIEQARFDEAILVLDRAATGEKTHADRLAARILKADALFAMGADNSARYEAALDAYRTVVSDEALSAGERLSVAFKIGRVLEKLKRTEEATDQYYAQVVLAYRDGRSRGETFGSEGEAAFVRAAFRLADGFEARGRDYQAVGVLGLVAESNVPASVEARKRIERISKKGRFL